MVQYSTTAMDTLKEATSDGSTVFDYYNSPLFGTPLPLAAQSGTVWDVTTQTNPLSVHIHYSRIYVAYWQQYYVVCYYNFCLVLSFGLSWSFSSNLVIQLKNTGKT